MNNELFFLIHDLKNNILFNKIDSTTDEFYLYLIEVIKTVLESPKNNKIILEMISCLSYMLLTISDLNKIQSIQFICKKFLENSFQGDYRHPDYILEYKEYTSPYYDLFISKDINKII